MKMSRRTALLAGAVGLVFASAGSLHAQQKELTIMASMPQMAFPFFVHMVKQIEAEGQKLGGITIQLTDGQGSSPKQTSDLEAAVTQGVDGIIISPNDVDAMAPAHPGGDRRRRSGGDHRPPGRQGARHPRPCRRRQCQGRRGPGQPDPQAVPQRRDRHEPAGRARRPARRSTATRACTTSSIRSRTSTRSSSRTPRCSPATKACR